MPHVGLIGKAAECLVGVGLLLEYAAEPTKGHAEHPLAKEAFRRGRWEHPGGEVTVGRRFLRSVLQTFRRRGDTQTGANEFISQCGIEALLPRDVIQQLGQVEGHTIESGFLQNRVAPAVQLLERESVFYRITEELLTAEIGIASAAPPAAFPVTFENSACRSFPTLHRIQARTPIGHIAPDSRN